MSEWQTMEAGRELDRVIAERLGCRVEWREGLQAYGVRHPDGILSGKYTSTEDAWAKHKFPPFSTSVDAALTLLPPKDFVLWEISGEDGEWKATLYIGSTSEGTFTAQTLALAICRAWLAWHESKG